MERKATTSAQRASSDRKSEAITSAMPTWAVYVPMWTGMSSVGGSSR